MRINRGAIASLPLTLPLIAVVLLSDPHPCAEVAFGCELPNTAPEVALANELETLQGTWKVVKVDPGQDGPREYVQTHGRVVIKGDKLTLMFVDGNRPMKVLECTLKLNPAKAPKTIDLTIDFISILVPDTKESQKALEETTGKMIFGIYDLKGNTIDCFFSEVGAERPMRFPTSAGGGVVTLHRVEG